MSRITAIVLTVARWVVGLLFIVSGLIKVNDPLGFSYKLEEYFHVFDARFTEAFSALVPYSLAFSMGIAVAEVVLGVLLLLGLLPRLCNALLLLMIAFFTWLTGYSAITGSVTDCGCFGDAIKLTPWQSFYKDLVLLVLILFLYRYRHAQRPLLARGGALLAGLATAGAVVLCVYCYRHLPIIDFRPYRVGSDLAYNISHYSAEGVPIAKDYVPLKNTCGQDELQGTTLMIVIYRLEEAAPEHLQASASLAQALQGRGVQVMGSTASGSEVRKQYTQLYNLPYCLAPNDGTVLRTIIRSHPGYVLLHQGRVVAMWHHNDLPTAEQVLASIPR